MTAGTRRATLNSLFALGIAGTPCIPASANPAPPAGAARATTAGPLLSNKADTLHFILATDGNAARFRVKEQLAGFDLPNDAVGETTKVDGTIAFDDAGAVVRSASKVTIDLASLKSDQDRRDNYIKRRTLQVDSFPSAVFVPTQVRGLTFPLGEAGTLQFQMIGDMTVHGVTKPITWDVTAKSNGGEVTGQATTRVKFADFGMSIPRVARVLSVEDDIRLEYDFHFVRAP